MIFNSLTKLEMDSLAAEMIKTSEQFESQVYDAGDGLSTIGYGYTFERYNNVALWTSAGISLTEAEWETLRQIDAETSRAEKTRLARGFGRTITEQEASDLLAAIYPEQIKALDSVSEYLQDSREKAALASAFYGVNPDQAPTRYAPLYDAIRAGDRAEIWFQLRYHSFTSTLPGVKVRRYIESTVFGLYDTSTGSVPTLAESENILQMFTRRRQEILRTESLWAEQRDLANRDARFADIRSEYGNVLEMQDLLTPAADLYVSVFLEAHPEIASHLPLLHKFQATSIYLVDLFRGLPYAIPFADWDAEKTIDQSGNEIISSDLMIGGVGSDRIRGGSGNDVLFGDGGTDTLDGGAGDDILAGGSGADRLVGGSGNDIYVVDATSGQASILDFDTIDDSDGNGSLFIRQKFGASSLDTKIHGHLEWIKNDVWADSSGLYMVVKIENSLYITTRSVPSRVVAKIEHWSDGELGITLQDKPTTPAIAVTHNGTDGGDYIDTVLIATAASASAIDFVARQGDVSDVATAHSATQAVFSPGARALGGAGSDMLLGRTGQSDLLEGGAGNDIISGEFGHDELYGDGGNDFISGMGEDSVAHGGDGNDVLTAADMGGLRLGGTSGLADQGTIWKDLSRFFTWKVADPEDAFKVFENGEIRVDIDFDQFGENWSFSGVSVNGRAFRFYQNPTDASGFRLEYMNDSGYYESVISFGLVSHGSSTYYTYDRGVSLYGDAGDDVINGSDADDYLDGGTDNDLIAGGGGADIILGGTGSDTAHGGSGDDVIAGGSGDDHLYGNKGADILEGGDGDDYLQGDDFTEGGDDHLDGGAGNDLMLGGMGSDTIYGGDGNDHIHGDADNINASEHGNDNLYGGAGDDIIFGGAGHDLISGDDGNDQISGGEGNDSLRGGHGNDTLFGGAGNDTFSFDAGWGNDVIGDINGGGADIVRFGAGISPTTLQVSIGTNSSLIIRSQDGVDSVTLQGYFDSANNGHRIEFADGTVWTLQTLQDRFAYQGYGSVYADTYLAGPLGGVIDGSLGDDILMGGSGNDMLLGGMGSGYSGTATDNDVLMGGAGDDWLEGQRGNDTLDGGSGKDTLLGGEDNDALLGGAGDDTLNGGSGENLYLFQQGFGQDRIILSDSQYSYENALIRFTNGITASAVTAYMSGRDLVLQVGQDKITIVGYATRQYARIAVEFADGSTLAPEFSQLLSSFVGSPYDDALSGTPYNDIIKGGDGHDTLKGMDGSDRMIGGSGNDLLEGGNGSDIYEYGNGDGGDTIVEVANDASNASDIDTLSFANGVSPESLSLYRDGNDLVVVVGSATQQVRIRDHFLASGSKQIERFVFADAAQTVWDSAAIALRVSTGVQNGFTGTSGSDTYIVDHADDTIAEAINGGTDTVLSSVSYQLPDNVENITLTGHLNINATGNRLDNVLTGNDGNNVLRGFFDDGTGGEDGNDTAYGGKGDDEYYSIDNIFENAGEGYDTKYTNLTDDTLQDNLERLVVTGAWYKSAVSANVYTGNALDNVIDVSSIGMSVIDGGLGADRMIWRGNTSGQSYGLPRSVTFVIDNAGDTWEVLAEGYDIELRSSLDGIYHWDSRISSYESTSTGVVEIHGDANANRIGARQAAAGSVLSGGLGNDTYMLGAGSIGYTILEAADGGTDTVEWSGVGGWTGASSTADISGHQNVENVVLLAESESANVIGNGAANTIDGNDYANVIDGRGGDDIMSGRKGNDIYYVDSAADVVIEANNINWNDNQGYDTIYSSVDYTIADAVEELRLTGNAVTATGNANGNRIVGNAFDNVIDGRGGSGDILEGGAGNDTILFGNGFSQRLEGGDGSDTFVQQYSGSVLAEIIESDNIAGQTDVLKLDSTVLPQDVSVKRFSDYFEVVYGDSTIRINKDSVTGNSTVERIVFDNGTIWNIDEIAISNPPPTSSGSFNEVALRGRSFQFVIPPNAFADTPDDILSYWAELPDWLSFDPVTRTISGTVPTTATGTVVIPLYATDSWNQTATSQLTLNLYQPREGTSGADSLTGTSAADAIYGYAGNDSLNGGSGADMLVGGTGDDSYTVDNIGDQVIELASEGNDLVTSSISYTLSANVERLTLSGTSAINGTGNDLANTINGNSAVNILTGGAGNDTINGNGGIDTMIGGTGDDSYTVDNSAEVVTEQSGEGYDQVSSSATYVLSANVEKLTLTGTTAINGTGNAGDNMLVGNSGNNTLTGGAGNDTLDGGTGSDTMLGGTGDDVYFVNVSTDVVTENANEGIDTVNAGITYSIASAANIENISLTGTTAINATGNNSANVLIGNSGTNAISAGAGNDTLDGGAGTDTLTGGTGNDTYRMARGHGVDTVVENDATAGNHDVAKFLTGIAFDQLWFSRPSGSNNLEITIIGTSDKMVVKDWYLGAQYRTEEIQVADGNRYLLAADVQTLVNAMAGLTPPPMGQTTLSASQRTSLDTALASWKTGAAMLTSSLPAETAQGSGPLPNSWLSAATAAASNARNRSHEWSRRNRHYESDSLWSLLHDARADRDAHRSMTTGGNATAQLTPPTVPGGNPWLPPPGVLPSGVLSPGALPPGVLPPTVPPRGVLPPESLPRDARADRDTHRSMATGGNATAQLTPGTAPGGNPWLPPPGVLPSGVLSPGALPPGVLPRDVLPPGVLDWGRPPVLPDCGIGLVQSDCGKTPTLPDCGKTPATSDGVKTPVLPDCGKPSSNRAVVLSNCNRLVDLMAMSDGNERELAFVSFRGSDRNDQWTP